MTHYDDDDCDAKAQLPDGTWRLCEVSSHVHRIRSDAKEHVVGGIRWAVMEQDLLDLKNVRAALQAATNGSIEVTLGALASLDPASEGKIDEEIEAV